MSRGLNRATTTNSWWRNKEAEERRGGNFPKLIILLFQRNSFKKFHLAFYFLAAAISSQIFLFNPLPISSHATSFPLIFLSSASNYSNFLRFLSISFLHSSLSCFFFFSKGEGFGFNFELTIKCIIKTCNRSKSAVIAIAIFFTDNLANNSLWNM